MRGIHQGLARSARHRGLGSPVRGGVRPDRRGGPENGPTLVFHGHYDVVPARPEQFTPRIQGDRLEGRGSYDMKGGLAAMMCALQDLKDQDAVRIRFVCVPDEESEEIDQRTSDLLVKAGYIGDFAITGEPTDLHVGVQAKGVLALRSWSSARPRTVRRRGSATTPC